MSQPDNVTPVGALAPVGTRTPVDALIPAEAQTLVDGLTSAEVPAPPDEVAEVFGVATASAIAYAGILATRGVEWGVIGPREVPRLWDRHLLNCAVVAELVGPECSTLADVGSGAGLPGVVLAMLLPKVDVTLVEPLERRARFLADCVAELGLANASVLRGRAEDLKGQLSVDVVTARAVAPLERLVPLAVGLVRRKGMVLAIKGSGAADELRRAQPALRRVGARSAEVLSIGHGKVDPATTVVRFFAR
jgi:16S rRNA (guanine527-N7)-methyltransferase